MQDSKVRQRHENDTTQAAKAHTPTSTNASSQRTALTVATVATVEKQTRPRRHTGSNR